MGLGSRFLNLFSPGKGKQGGGNGPNLEDDSSSAEEGGEQISFSEDPSNSTSATTTPPSAGTKVAAAAKQSSSSSKTKGHCNFPGCTRALSARGKCYRHDNETRSSGKKSSARKSLDDDDDDEKTSSNGGGKKPNGKDGDKKKSSKKNNDVDGEKATSAAAASAGKKKKREEASEDKKPAAAAKKPEAQKAISPKKGHCSHPGCTRALFARGKCYRHDNGTQSGKKLSTPRSIAPADDERKPSANSDGKKKSASESKKVKNEQATPIAAKKATPTSKSASGSKHCSHPGCTRALFARGKCYRHDQEAKRSDEASPAVNTPSKSSTTSSSGKKRKSSDVESAKKAKISKSASGSKHCSHPGCTRALFARGMCYRHDTEAKRSGGGVSPAARSISTPSPPPKSTKNMKIVASSSEAEQSSSAKKKGHCNYPGCTRALFARGKCYRHDQETKSGKKYPSRGTAKNRTGAATASKKSNAKSAVPILPSLTKALTSSSQRSQRKSAIARRPRQLKPTQKLLAMQEDALNAVEAKDGEKRKNSNGGNRKRGGKREGYSPPNKKMRVSRGAEGGVSMEELTANTYDDDDDESNYDNVVCCLCK